MKAMGFLAWELVKPFKNLTVVGIILPFKNLTMGDSGEGGVSKVFWGDGLRSYNP
jgi:hypothetical protein